jgi:hypothetical protein
MCELPANVPSPSIEALRAVKHNAAKRKINSNIATALAIDASEELVICDDSVLNSVAFTQF